jgi:hypothetical protein
MLGFSGFGHAIEATAELNDSTAFTQRVERVGVHSSVMRSRVRRVPSAGLYRIAPKWPLR